MTTPDIHTLTGAYAVDALPDDERREFERHLDSCAACQQEVDELRTTAAQLGGAIAETPPAGMRAAVLAAIEDVRQERRSTEVVAIDRGREWMPRVLGAAAAAFLVVVLGLTVVVSSLNSRLDDLDATNTQVTEVLAAEDLDTVELEGDVGTVRVAFSPTRGQGVLIGTGLEPLPESRVYELWFLEGSDPVPAGLFAPDAEGRVTFAVNGDLGRVEAFAVTIEPEGGSPAPTTEPVLVGAV